MIIKNIVVVVFDCTYYHAIIIIDSIVGKAQLHHSFHSHLDEPLGVATLFTHKPLVSKE